MYVLHSWQGHASGFHDLINFLNLLKLLLNIVWHKLLEFWAKINPWWTVFVFSLLNWLQDDIKLYEGFCSSKTSFYVLT